ncbi:glycosyltransferase [Burkholderia sp. WAC0059]|uniref:tetratricopeptide repeat-containing glycosyltransferase family protein n=1 Tax=Burkholderia sp. WAC0059 TaxID=2066022 RepID=UPI000C7E8F52|nr:tetratricopeptide repeat-containing glycosyltransferase family protein [Burkholderia sp. WAC0059]PLZ03805.1 glycosyltransferase [Burkholderia sp. WAC0059]
MTQDLAPALAAAQQHFAAGRLDEAAAQLDAILAAHPEHGEALEGLGYIAAKRGDHALAADYVTRALGVMRASPEQYHWAAQVCLLAERYDEAARYFRHCLQHAPDHAQSLHGLAMTLMARGEYAEALVALERLCARYPLLAEAHYNRGNALGTLGRYDDEMAAYRRALELKPDFAPAQINLGVALRDLHRFDEALQQFRRVLARDPNDAGARTNRAQTNLLLGEFEHGWREYEWRWHDGAVAHGFDPATQWDGRKPVAGRTVFVHHEQGLGDTLQFVRYVDLLAEAGARVVLRVQDALLPLLRDYPGAAQVIGEQESVPAFDLHSPLLSLPFAFGTRATNIPARIPYLRADPAKAGQWRDLLPPDDESGDAGRKPRIGVAWSGSRLNRNGRNRAMTLAQLAPLFDADAHFVSLQKEVREEDRALLADLDARATLRDASARLVTFADTAALVDQLDLVVSVDTSVAHLAGALGKPVWVALPYTPDWRWQMNREDSPWYPQMRLFRQPRRDDWPAVVEALRQAPGPWRAS